MIAELLPRGVHAVEVYGDVDAALFPEEEALLAGAVASRRREFASARHCARLALGALGLPPAPLLPDRNRAPRWPAGVVGSITHCSGYRAAAVAPADGFATVGIDAEPHEPLPPGVRDVIARPDEADRLDALARSSPQVRWDRLLFSAKESVYKAWSPLTGRWLGFEQVAVTFATGAAAFTAHLPADALVLPDGTAVDRLHGTWMARHGLVLTAVTLPLRPTGQPVPPR